MAHRLRTTLPTAVLAAALALLTALPAAADAAARHPHGKRAAAAGAHLSGHARRGGRVRRRAPVGVRMVPAGKATPAQNAPAFTPSAPQPGAPTAPASLQPGAMGPFDVLAPFPATLRPFAATSVWNQLLAAGAPLDPASGRLATALANEVRSEIDKKTGPWINTTKWSVPVYTVGRDVPRVYVHLDNNKPALQRDFESVPVPARAVASNDSDATLAIYQPDTDTYWDFWRMRRAADGWHAVWGGKMTGVSSNPGYFADKRGASASSLALLGGLITIADLEAGRIDHALAMAVPTTAAGTFTWPAQRSDGKTTGPSAIPEGTHFRIDPALDLSTLGLTPEGLVIARAAQRYGIVVRDGAANVTFYAEDPASTGANPYGRLFRGRYANEVLRGFPWNRLQVVAPSG
jgi:hypothetical protein